MRFLLFLLLLVTLVAMVTINALPVDTGTEVYEVNIRLIKESHSEQPAKRSVHGQAHNLPDHLVIGVPVEKNKADTILRLKRKPFIPMVTTDGRRYDSQKNVSVYTDASRYSPMIVRRDAGQYSLEGTFHHGGKEWNIKPLAEKSRSPFGHQLESLGPNDGDERFSHESDFYKRIVGDAAKPEESTRHDKNISRHKRSSRTLHVIETTMVVDYRQYDEWLTFLQDEVVTLELIQITYTYFAESINIRFESIEDDIAVSFRAVHLSVMTDEGEGENFDALVLDDVIDGGIALLVFKGYLDQHSEIPTSDHYILFTGYEVSGGAGHANYAAMCLATSLSIVEYTGDAQTALHAAHQLGHSLSAVDDAATQSCNDADQFIMSGTNSVPVNDGNTGNPWRFSPCSIDAIMSQFEGQDCTSPASTTLPSGLPPLDGQQLDLTSQCMFYFSSLSTQPCGDASNVCKSLFCMIPGEINGEEILVQEYTSCGEVEWCIAGECVLISTTNTATTSTSTTTTTPMSTTTTATTTTTTTAPTTTTTTPMSTTTTATTTTTTTPMSTTTTATTTTTTTPMSTTARATTTTAATTTTEDPNPEPTKIWMCLGRIFTDWREWWRCTKTALGRIFG